MEKKNEKMRVLVANGPKVYREVIAVALPVLRPLLEVYVAEPEELEREVGRLRPHLVICDRAGEAIRQACLLWVVLYPDGEDRAEICISSGTSTVEGGVSTRHLIDVAVADLLSVIDEMKLVGQSV